MVLPFSSLLSQGTYVYFDYNIMHDDLQTGWCYRRKENFTFRLASMDNILCIHISNISYAPTAPCWPTGQAAAGIVNVQQILTLMTLHAISNRLHGRTNCLVHIAG